MPRWVRAIDIGECTPGTAREVVVEDRIVALFNVDGKFHALDGICPHQGGPLGQGEMCGTTVTCPWHGWQFDVTSGQNRLSKSIVQATFAVRIEGNDVLVDLESGS